MTTHGDVSGALGGRYCLERPLGRGSTAEVWLATDERLGREVAVKLFAAEVGDPAAHARIEAELRVLARLRHPGLVVVHDAGFDGGRPYLVMELVAGASLQQRLAAGPLGVRATAAVGRALAEALTRVHAAGVVHRDVKPANILLEPADSGWPVVRLADFGIARLDDAPPLTAEGMTIGTANYLSPEQVRGEGAGPASDVYSLGLVLIECLSGRVEYAGPGVEAALARLSRDPAVPSSAPEPLRGLLVAMTARDPAVRPTAAAVAAQLAAAASAADQEQGTTVLPAVAQPAPARESVAGTAVLPARPARSRRAAVLAVVVAAVVMAAVIAAVITAVAAGSGPLPSGPPHYPSVPGRLGTHLVQLERAVG